MGTGRARNSYVIGINVPPHPLPVFLVHAVSKLCPSLAGQSTFVPAAILTSWAVYVRDKVRAGDMSCLRT